jgi:hypothetical protein
MRGTSIVSVIVGYASRLRFPVLAALTAAAFLADLLVPDLIPFIDELVLGLAAVFLGALRRRRQRPLGGADPRAPGEP